MSQDMSYEGPVPIMGETVQAGLVSPRTAALSGWHTFQPAPDPGAWPGLGQYVFVGDDYSVPVGKLGGDEHLGDWPQFVTAAVRSVPTDDTFTPGIAEHVLELAADATPPADVVTGLRSDQHGGVTAADLNLVSVARFERQVDASMALTFGLGKVDANAKVMTLVDAKLATANFRLDIREKQTRVSAHEARRAAQITMVVRAIADNKTRDSAERELADIDRNLLHEIYRTVGGIDSAGVQPRDTGGQATAKGILGDQT